MIHMGELAKRIKAEFKLEPDGIHGTSHWARVKRLGRLLSEDRHDDELITLFALLHDVCRESDYGDHDHGHRAVMLAHELNGDYFAVAPAVFTRLCYAMEHHSEGFVHRDAGIQTCWAADRLDLGRLGIAVEPNLLGLPTAQRLLKIGWPYGLSPRGKALSRDRD